ncbi:putative DnaJ domain-containing protein [Medicago truncatula]|uniref:Auxilin-like protein n=1 Tax=Medicago truncatula TaxID=3880 RepID=A0A072VPW1_MEDTR|nr:auxilin-like protein 1 [Medicago truncatula]KEH40170.1 auxilin-like protein [Medicago truncatula]RHN77491.1 putative DnaJ domain-containing protein [Medicago truncatula]
MEFGATTSTLTKKHSNSYSVTGRSAYDGVFATPIKLRTPSFSQFDDYNEVFGCSDASSSIPILELPELNESRMVEDFQRSNLDYSKVFSGFDNLDTTVPFEELIPKPKASKRSKVKSGEQSCREDRVNSSKEIPVISPSSNGAKTINMSYHKVNQGSENGTNGTTHIAKLHAVPAYTCLIEEVSSVKTSRAKWSIPAAKDAFSGIHCDEGIKEGGRCDKSSVDASSNNVKKQFSNNGGKAINRSDSVDMFYDEGIKEGGLCDKSSVHASPNNVKKQSSNNGGKAINRSDSVDMFYDACETSKGSDTVHEIKVPPSQTVTDNLDHYNDIDTSRSTATKCQASQSGTYESAAGADSPTYLEDTVDSNSAAAASVAALRKAIEEAQMKIKVAKESMRRKKEGFPDHVKQKSSIDLKVKEKKEAKLACKTSKVKEINTRQTFGEMDALLQVSSDVGKLPMRTEKVRSDIGDKEMCTANEAVQEVQNKLKLSPDKHKEEVELKEADHKGKNLELKEAGNAKKVPYIKNTGRNATEKPEESDHAIEMVEEYWEQENGEEKVRAVNEASYCEELVHETKQKCQEVAGETNLIHETLDSGVTDKRLKVKEVENKVTPFNEPKGSVINLGGKSSMMRKKESIGYKPEDGKKTKWSIDQEECQKILRAIQELGNGDREISQEQKESENKVEVVSEFEECELTESPELLDNEGPCSPHHSELISMDKEIYNSGCLEDKKRRNASGSWDVNQEVEHSYWREATDSTFSNINVKETLEDIVDHIHHDEEIHERNAKASDLNGNVRLQDAHACENDLEGATHPMEENESERKDNKVLEVIIETQTDLIYEEIREEESGNTSESSSSYEPDETEKLNKTQVSNTVNENDETHEVTPEFYSCDLQDDIMVTSNASVQRQEKYEEPESVQVTNDLCEKHAGQTSDFDEGAPLLSETVYQMNSTFETVTIDDDSTNVGETDMMKVRQNQDQCLEKAESDCDLVMLLEETTPESIEICMDAKEHRVVSDEEIEDNRSTSSCEASQIPFKEEEVKSIPSKIKESHQTSVTKEVKEANGKSQKVEVDRELLKKIDEVKNREREKEKLAVERAIREARERAFADARERAALERVAAEARQKNILNGRERLKTTSQANEKTPAEKTAMEAKLKAERAAVERATAEARARALERALSEKAAYDAKNKSDKSVPEKYVGASRSNGTKQNAHSKSFSYGVRDSTGVFDGANADSAQRCKARSERHQRIGERVAKALAEKSMRDRLVQKEQEERHRVAEALDADVKRWSSGKAGNLRALLSTLQYILGPDSGWQPIPLTAIVTTPDVKKAYRKATLCVHPDKLQQRGASIQQKYTCEKVFDLLKEAWNRFNMEER